MEDREIRGLQLAATKKIRKGKDGWVVPSQTGDGTFYNVSLEQQKCSCPDHETRQVKCKHIYAVEFTIRRETDANGNVTTTKTVRVTYAQNWTAYNAAQSEEKTQFAALLTDLCKTVPQPPQTNGRPRLPMSDMAFACTFKVYTMFSARRFTSDLEEAKADGLIAKRPHFNSVSNYLANPALTSVLKELITASSLPLKAIETDFAVDSSGFGTSRFVRWYNKKYGREIDNREWVKVHLMCGVKTHTVTAAEISGWAANDTTYFAPLVEETAKHFQIAEVSADKAYLGHKNLAIVESLGATPFVPFKSNTVAATGESAWAKMYHYYMFNRDTFLAHYHKRSNVETVFSMIKGKFGDSVRSKGNVAQVNEVLCKVLCHNICVLVQSMHELGIAPTFASQPLAALA
ncbi:MAG: transposase [Dehalococcoidia bacterium]|nr:transposase [Dehalococcoidia bacterium]